MRDPKTTTCWMKWAILTYWFYYLPMCDLNATCWMERAILTCRFYYLLMCDLKTTTYWMKWTILSWCCFYYLPICDLKTMTCWMQWAKLSCFVVLFFVCCLFVFCFWVSTEVWSENDDLLNAVSGTHPYKHQPPFRVRKCTNSPQLRVEHSSSPIRSRLYRSLCRHHHPSSAH